MSGQLFVPRLGPGLMPMSKSVTLLYRGLLSCLAGESAFIEAMV